MFKMLPIQNINAIVANELDRLEEMRQYNILRRNLRDASDPFNLNDQHFIDLFRLNKYMAQYVFERISNWMDVRENPVAVPPILRYFAVLYFFATGSYQRTIGQSFNLGVSQPTVSSCITEVSRAVVHVLGHEWIKFPQTIHEINLVKTRFMEASQFPGVIGAIDCTHIAIIAPREEEHNYMNRKGYHSKNVQVICDRNLKILNVNANYGGSAHDSFIWRHSGIQELLQHIHLQGNTNTWLLGDSGYPQQPWLMTPLLHAVEGTPEYRYTERHISARNVVERCFAVFKGRFRCLLQERTLRYDPQKVGLITNVCCILHNICIEGNLDINYGNIAEDDHGNEEMEIAAEGQLAGRNLINLYFNN